MSKDGKKKSGIGKFVAGALVGGALGVLFAPRSGTETRKLLKQKIDDLVEKVKDIDPQDVADSITMKIEELKMELADLDKEKVIEIAKEKAEAIKTKAEEIVDLAVEKGTPVVQKAAEDVRQQAIKVTKQVLKKLEGN